MENHKKIILFDGVCNLCNHAVQYIIVRDKRDMFRFASLQSDVGLKLTRERHIDTAQTDSIVFIDPGVAYYTKATAALKIARHFGGLWKLAIVLEWLPKGFTNWCYDWVAANRYRWFGKREDCMIPTPELKAKFLD